MPPDVYHVVFNAPADGDGLMAGRTSSLTDHEGQIDRDSNTWLRKVVLDLPVMLGGRELKTITDRDRETIGMYVLDINQKPFYFEGLDDWRVENRDDSSSSITLLGTVYGDPLAASAERIIRLLKMGSLVGPGSWLLLERQDQARWCSLADGARALKGVFPRIGEVFLDMTQVDSEMALYCALGEAVMGPGFSMGIGLSSIEDALFKAYFRPTVHLLNYHKWALSQETDLLPKMLNEINSGILDLSWSKSA